MILIKQAGLHVLFCVATHRSDVGLVACREVFLRCEPMHDGRAAAVACTCVLVGHMHSKLHVSAQQQQQ